MSEKLRIAIVDDHVLFRKSLKLLIDLFPLSRVVSDASNGKEFIDNLQQGELPDIVLLDISMPVMDGYATATWLQHHFPEMKVLALSTMESETAIIRMIKCGSKGYLLKDAEPEELKLAFEDVMTRGYYYNDLVSRKVLRSVHQLADSRNHPAVFAKLSEREVAFLKFVCTELAYKEIADRMSVSVRTVEGYRDTLCEKLGLKTRVGLAIYAVKNGLVDVHRMQD